MSRMPTHCSVVDQHPGDDYVPAMRDPPAANIMDPALQCGLYNPNAYVRGGAVEAMGKMYGANVMRKAKREESDAKARMKLRASENANVPWTLGILTDEELAAFEELVEEHEDDEGKGPHVSATVMEIEGEEPAVRATPLESAGEEKTPRVEELGIQPTGKQKKAKRPKPAPVGTAWFLQRGKELDSKRTD